MSQEMNIELNIDEGDPLGATPNEKLVIVKIQPDTIADGKLKVGDQIVELNGTKLSDRDDFFKRWQFAAPFARLKIVRDTKKAEELEGRVHIPTERAGLIQRRHGYSYFICCLAYRPNGPKLGLAIKTYQNRVLVSRADPGSMAAEQLQLGDHILDVDGTPVTDKDVARSMIVAAIKRTGIVSFVVERPETGEAKQWTRVALAAETAQPPSVNMSADVLEIMAAARNFYNGEVKTLSVASIMRPSPDPEHHVKIDANVYQQEIVNDNAGRALRHVKQ